MLALLVGVPLLARARQVDAAPAIARTPGCGRDARAAETELRIVDAPSSLHERATHGLHGCVVGKQGVMGGQAIEWSSASTTVAVEGDRVQALRAGEAVIIAKSKIPWGKTLSATHRLRVRPRQRAIPEVTQPADELPPVAEPPPASIELFVGQVVDLAPRTPIEVLDPATAKLDGSSLRADAAGSTRVRYSEGGETLVNVHSASLISDLSLPPFEGTTTTMAIRTVIDGANVPARFEWSVVEGQAFVEVAPSTSTAVESAAIVMVRAIAAGYATLRVTAYVDSPPGTAITQDVVIAIAGRPAPPKRGGTLGFFDMAWGGQICAVHGPRRNPCKSPGNRHPGAFVGQVGGSWVRRAGKARDGVGVLGLAGGLLFAIGRQRYEFTDRFFDSRLQFGFAIGPRFGFIGRKPDSSHFALLFDLGIGYSLQTFWKSRVFDRDRARGDTVVTHGFLVRPGLFIGVVSPDEAVAAGVQLDWFVDASRVRATDERPGPTQAFGLSLALRINPDKAKTVAP